MNILKFAAIDIGSNAVRLLLSNVMEEKEGPIFSKASLTRVPLRLGMDAFTQQKISDKKIEQMLHTMHAFKHLTQVYEIKGLRGCATSAMREASNGQEIVRQIQQECGIDIEIIEGKKEAEIIYSTQIANQLDEHKDYLYVDVGGGSTEVTLFSNGREMASHSFNIGTIRILNKNITSKEWKFLETWVKETAIDHENLSIIGSGGNINKIFKLCGRKKGKPLKLHHLEAMYTYLDSLSLDERMRSLNLKPDRADVIVPAAEIFLHIMKAGNIKKVYVPKVGLADGIVRKLYDEYRNL